MNTSYLAKVGLGVMLFGILYIHWGMRLRQAVESIHQYLSILLSIKLSIAATCHREVIHSSVVRKLRGNVTRTEIERSGSVMSINRAGRSRGARLQLKV